MTRWDDPGADPIGDIRKALQAARQAAPAEQVLKAVDEQRLSRHEVDLGRLNQRIRERIHG